MDFINNMMGGEEQKGEADTFEDIADILEETHPSVALKGSKCPYCGYLSVQELEKQEARLRAANRRIKELEKELKGFRQEESVKAARLAKREAALEKRQRKMLKKELPKKGNKYAAPINFDDYESLSDSSSEDDFLEQERQRLAAEKAKKAEKLVPKPDPSLSELRDPYKGHIGRYTVISRYIYGEVDEDEM